jgi:hypothetical protein
MAGSDVNDQVRTLRQVRQENFLTCYEIFVCDDAMFTVSECMAISLTDLNGSAISPDEIQIATIIHQVSCSYHISLNFNAEEVGADGA